MHQTTAVVITSSISYWRFTCDFNWSCLVGPGHLYPSNFLYGHIWKHQIWDVVWVSGLIPTDAAMIAANMGIGRHHSSRFSLSRDYVLLSSRLMTVSPTEKFPAEAWWLNSLEHVLSSFWKQSAGLLPLARKPKSRSVSKTDVWKQIPLSQLKIMPTVWFGNSTRANQLHPWGSCSTGTCVITLPQMAWPKVVRPVKCLPLDFT